MYSFVKPQYKVFFKSHEWIITDIGPCGKVVVYQFLTHFPLKQAFWQFCFAHLLLFFFLRAQNQEVGKNKRNSIPA